MDKIIGKRVEVVVDRPLGSSHPDFPETIYPVNYGYIPGIIGGDGEAQDAYVLGVDSPVERFVGEVIALIIRKDDNEIKWVVAPEGQSFSKEEIRDFVEFQEKYFDSKIILSKNDFCDDKRAKNKKIITISAFCLLIAMLLTSVCILLYKEFSVEEESYYDQKCASFVIQNQNLSKGQIVFIGDSITDLYPLDDYYSDLALATYNRGIGGDVTQGVISRLGISLFDLEPEKIVIMIGTNDINGGMSIDYIKSNYVQILDSIKERLPDSKVYFMSVIPQNKDLEEYTVQNVDNNNEQIKILNNEIKSLAETYKFEYIDLYSKTIDDDGYLASQYSDDGIHLNEKGFEIWTELLKPYLAD